MINEDYLKQNALWIIMDPWYPTPFKNDYIKCPNIDDLNYEILKKILNYFKEVKYQYIYHVHYQ
jgi:hypothetical protein